MKTEFWVTNFAAPGRAGRIARLYEEAGWDGLLFTDSQHHNGDVYQSLAIASVSTERIGLGTGVTNPLTRNAAVTAAAILSVQIESDGRAIHLQKVDDAFIDRFGVVGTPQQVVERLGAMLDQVPLGRVCMMHGSRGADPSELAEVRDCLAQEVLPKLR